MTEMSSLAGSEQEAVLPLVPRDVTKVYWPLALSWVFMALEGQIAMWLVGIMPETKISQAGLLIVMSLAIFIESPVIDLLSTSTTLGTSKRSYQALRKFALILMAWVTFAHCTVMFTPLYPLVSQRILGASPEVAGSAWYALALMPFWSACVGWRRFLQGIMIRAGVTRPISWGTLVRIIAMIGVGYPLVFSPMHPLAVIGIAMSAAVFAEAVYVHVVSRPVVRRLPSGDGDPEPALSGLFKFHLPLTAATMLMLTAPLFVSRGLTSSSTPVLDMAAWQTASTVIWLFRTITFALPEALISVHRRGSEPVLLRYCLFVGGSLTVLMLIFHFTQLDILTFLGLFRSDPDVAERAALAMLVCAALPALNSVMSFYRAMLTKQHVTSARLLAIGTSLVSLLAALALGSALRMPGVVVAAFALTVAHVVEMITLALAWKSVRANRPLLGS